MFVGSFRAWVSGCFVVFWSVGATVDDDGGGCFFRSGTRLTSLMPLSGPE